MNFKKMNFKGNKKPENPFANQDKRTFWEYISDNKKIVMPIILVVAVAITIGIALGANKKDAGETQENAAVEVDENGGYIVPEVDLEKNAYEDVNNLMNTYFTAYAQGDMDTIKSIYTGLESTEELRLQEVSAYISGIPTVDVYTKPGPVDGSYVAYVYTEVQFDGYDTPLPGMQTMYVCTNENGELYINGDVVDDRVTEYISAISLQADVVDLNNSVAADYNDIIASNTELADFLSQMSANIQVSVGEALAAIESGLSPDAALANTQETTDETAAEGEAAEGEAAEGEAEVAEQAEATEVAEAEAETAETQEEAEPVSTTKTIRATDVINIRKSDSETADVLGKTEKGQTFTQLEALENGWSKISYDGGAAYVKTMYFEEVTEDTAEATEEETETTEETTDTAEAETETEEETETKEEDTSESKSSVSAYATGKMRVSETVRLRKSQSTDSEVVTNVYAGDTINVIEQYASGWAKVEYNGDTGYIKSEYLMD